MIAKLTYATKSNKVAVDDRTTQATAEDFNEIKTVVNNCVDGINLIKADEVALTAGLNNVLFLVPYPAGVSFAIVVHNCYNPDGYLVAHTITNKTVNGFDVTVSEAVNFLYMATPNR